MNKGYFIRIGIKEDQAKAWRKALSEIWRLRSHDIRKRFEKEGIIVRLGNSILLLTNKRRKKKLEEINNNYKLRCITCQKLYKENIASSTKGSHKVAIEFAITVKVISRVFFALLETKLFGSRKPQIIQILLAPNFIRIPAYLTSLILPLTSHLLKLVKFIVFCFAKRLPTNFIKLVSQCWRMGRSRKVW